MDDLISRQAAIETIQRAFDRETLLYSFVRKVAVDALKTMPSAQPEQKKGKWINPSQNPEYVNKEFFYDCSVCGFTTTENRDTCPCCKTKMEV